MKRSPENGEPEPSMGFQTQLQYHFGNHEFEVTLVELKQCGGEVSRISDDLLNTVKRYQRVSDAHGMPGMKYTMQCLNTSESSTKLFTTLSISWHNSSVNWMIMVSGIKTAKAPRMATENNVDIIRTKVFTSQIPRRSAAV